MPKTSKASPRRAKSSSSPSPLRTPDRKVAKSPRQKLPDPRARRSPSPTLLPPTHMSVGHTFATHVYGRRLGGKRPKIDHVKPLEAFSSLLTPDLHRSIDRSSSRAREAALVLHYSIPKPKQFVDMTPTDADVQNSIAELINELYARATHDSNWGIHRLPVDVSNLPPSQQQVIMKNFRLCVQAFNEHFALVSDIVRGPYPNGSGQPARLTAAYLSKAGTSGDAPPPADKDSQGEPEVDHSQRLDNGVQDGRAAVTGTAGDAAPQADKDSQGEPEVDGSQQSDGGVKAGRAAVTGTAGDAAPLADDDSQGEPEVDGSQRSDKDVQGGQAADDSELSDRDAEGELDIDHPIPSAPGSSSGRSPSTFMTGTGSTTEIAPSPP
ncbi:hypothetical protein GGF50DRAFT_92973 [Schizophyllum commune]